jgi:regulatory protein
MCAKSTAPLTPEKALTKAQRYCAFQERSQQEVRDKLYGWGLHRNQVEQLISQLIGDGFLKEERFAEAFAGGKFRIKKWGKVKIKQALKAKQVSEPLIRKALASISDKDYRKMLEKVIADKASKTIASNSFTFKQQLARYAISRGFEAELVWEVIGEQE